MARGANLVYRPPVPAPKMSAVPTPAPTHDELGQAAQAAMAKLPGLRAADLKKLLPKPYQALYAEALQILRDLASRGTVFRFAKGKVERFFAADPVATLDREVPVLLSRTGPLTPAALKKAVATAAPGHQDLVPEWTKSALVRNLVFLHDPPPRARGKRIGHAPDVRRALTKTLASLKLATSSLESVGVPRGQILDVLRDELGLGRTDDCAAFLATVDAIAFLHRPGTLLLVSDVRAKSSLSKERFDAAALAVAREGKVVLHHHDHAAALPEAERAALIHDGRGVYYVGIAKRGSA